VDNFLGFPVGTTVPSGYYDRQQAAWVPQDNGRVIKILNINNGLAELDVDGDGTADTGTALTDLGISAAELNSLANLYGVGKSLWRVPLHHFSPCDFNWPMVPPQGSSPPDNAPPPEPSPEPKPCKGPGSIIECENQTLGERIGIAGTPYTLNYRSDRVPGRKSGQTLDISLSGSSVPASLKRIDLELDVAGRRLTSTYPAAPNQRTTVTWDGLDSYGRSIQGRVPAIVRIGYVYQGQYLASLDQRLRIFGALADQGIPFTRVPRRNEITLFQEHRTHFGPWDGRGNGLGGWSLDVHHAYDPAGGVLYLGDGSQRRDDGLSTIIKTVAGDGSSGNNGDGGPATSASLGAPYGVAVMPDGTVYIVSGDYCLRKIGPDGIINAVPGFCGKGPSVNINPTYLATGPDGSLYILGSGRVWRLDNGVISLVAGNGGTANPAVPPDGVPAIAAPLNSPRAISVGADGTLYISDSSYRRVFQVRPDGTLSIFAGNGNRTSPLGDGGPARAANLADADGGLAVGPDGSVYIGHFSVSGSGPRVRRIGTDGIITTVAGGGPNSPNNGDGGLATQARLIAVRDLLVGKDGTLYIAETARVRSVRSDGTIRGLAGTGVFGFTGENGPASWAFLAFPSRLAEHPDGSLYVADVNNFRVRQIAPLLRGLSKATDIAIAAEDGSVVYIFNAEGRHLRTVHALTGATLYCFAYDSAGRLSSVTDGDGNVTSMERNSSGALTAIIGPYGQRTALTLDGNGYLASITNAGGEAYQMTYTAEGLLTGFKTPRGFSSQMSYDALGLLTRDEDAAGGFQSLLRSTADNSFKVTKTSALGRAQSYQVDFLSTGDKGRIVTFADGTQNIATEKADGSTPATFADGSTHTAVNGPDPRFGMQAPLSTSRQVKMPNGLTYAESTSSSAILTEPTNLLSLQTLTETQQVNGRTSTSAYDAATRIFTATSPAGRTHKSTIDPLGRVTHAQVGNLLGFDLAYDSRGHLSDITQGTGGDLRALSLSYNPQGYLDTVTDPLGRTTHYTYDAAGRVTEQTLPDNRVVQYGYDANGNLASITPPGRPAHRFDYTPIDQTAEYEPPDVGAGANSTRYSYNLDKQLTDINRPDGQVLHFNYNAAGKPSSQVLQQGELMLNTFGYNATTGKLASIASSDGIGLGYTYNGALLTAINWTGPVAGRVDISHDTDFRRNSLRVNGANPINFGYDADSLLTQAGSLALAYDAPNGLLTGTTLGSLTDSYEHNGFGEVSGFSASYAATSLLAQQYTRDALGRITQKVETISGVTATYDYGYDLAGRLTEVKKNSVVTASYSYDPNGNRLSGPGLITAPSYDDQDRLLTYGGASYTYTANGELATKTEGAVVTRYTYDVLGNLKSVTLPGGTIIDYLVDGRNRRVGKKVNGTLVQGFLWQDQLKPIAELDDSNNVVSRFVYATHVNVPDYMIKGGVTYRIVTDHLGSVRLVVNTADGTLMQRMDYDEFGKVLLDTNPGFQPFGFAGGLNDRDTGLVRFGARDYDAEIGRWTYKDPILFHGLTDNLYEYAYNEPVNVTDASGLSSSDVAKIVRMFVRKIREMTQAGERHPDAKWNNVCRNLLWCDYKRCSEQTMELYKEYSALELEDNWYFEKKNERIFDKFFPDLGHSWAEIRSSNPEDPLIILDPLYGKVQVSWPTGP
jgi:RHS repeat-associated protein